MAATYPRLVCSLIHLALVLLCVFPISPRAYAEVGLWPSDAQPTVLDAGPDGPVELGVRFHSDVDGVINGIRFYKSPANLGPHTVNVWSSSGDLLATAVSTDESPSGWQQVNLSAPVTIEAQIDYVVSYFCSAGHFSVTRNYFTSDINRGPLHARSASESGNGVYRYSVATTFPTDTYNGSNYWVDVDFEANPPGDVTKMVISPENPALSIGGSLQLSAAAIYSNQSERAITDEVVWSSSVADCATVDATGRVTGISIGSTTITAELGTLKVSVTVTVQLPPIPGSNIWPSGAMPVVMDAGPDSPVELGVKFRSNVNGKVRGVRFYKSTANAGVHLGSLWTSSGALLATAVFTDETASGWQDVAFASPVAIEAGTTYVASYFCPAGHFSVTRDYFTTSGKEPSSPLDALADGAAGGNGVFKYGPNSAFPTDTYNASHYWVDVDFVADPQGALTGIVVGGANSSLLVGETGQFTARAVYTNGSSEEITDQVTWTSSDVGVATIDASGTATGVSVGTSVLSAALMSVSGSATLKVQVAPPPSFSIWAPSSVPVVMDAGPDQAVELGVKFKSTVNGKIRGIRFYKHATNSGPHVGSLWSSTGELLGTAAFAGETESGWQEVNFASPVPVLGSTVYVASYFCPTGRFSVTRNYFSSQAATESPESPLQILTDAEANGNGVYMYGPSGGFPTSTYSSSNYWVDVNFEADEPGSVTSIVVRPAVSKLSIGTTQQFTALSVYSNGSTVDVTDQVSWTSSDPSRAAVNMDGLVAGLSRGLVTIAADLAGLSGSLDLEVGLTPVPGVHIWPSSTEPATVDVGPDNPVELGVKFRADRTGLVRGIRFYKAPTNTGTHIANLWSSTGTPLATATFTAESASGWQEATFSTPVLIEANTVYVASYFCPRGHFSVSRDYFAASGFGPSPLYAFAAGEVNGNGVFKYGSVSAFPNETYASSNYWVDIDFEAVSVKALSSISIAPQNPVVTMGGGQQFTATGVYSDGTTADLTGEGMWSSSANAIATIQSGGFASGLVPGVATISVTIGGVTGGTLFTVNPPLPTITATTAEPGASGLPFQFKIVAENSPNSYDAAGLPEGLTIDGATGLISGTPLKPGSSLITISATNAAGTVSMEILLTFLATLPYVADFESAEGYQVGALHGKLGWVVEQGAADITTEDPLSGVQSAELKGDNPPPIIQQTFADTSEEPIQYFDFFAKPVAHSNVENASAFQVEGAKFGFQLEGTRAILKVFNAGTTDGGFWESTAFSVPIDADYQAVTWVRLTARLNFTRHTWDLYADGVMVAADVNAVDGKEYLSTFQAVGTTVMSLRLDDIYAGPANPLFVDQNSNGLDDQWETLHCLSLSADNRDDSPTGNGVTVVQAYLKGTDPNDFFNGVAPTLVIMDGNHQSGPPSTFNVLPLEVAVWNQAGTLPLVDAPVTFAIVQGGGFLSIANHESATLMTHVTLRSDLDGTARAFFFQPPDPGQLSLMSASAGPSIVTFSAQSLVAGFNVIGFEAAEGFILGSIASQNHWGTDGAMAVVSSEEHYSGERALKILSSEEWAEAFREFETDQMARFVYVDFYARFAVGDDFDGNPLFSSNGVRITFQKDEHSADICVYDAEMDYWLSTPSRVSIDDTGSTTEWIRFTIIHDTQRNLSDVYVAGIIAMADVAPTGPTIPGLLSFSVGSAYNVATYIDDLGVGSGNPLFPDADHDGMNDGWELTHGLDITLDDADADKDGDQLSNMQEFLHGSLPNSQDTDSDGMWDGWEIQNGLDPTSMADASLPSDIPGKSNLEKAKWVPGPINIVGMAASAGPFQLTWAADAENGQVYEIYANGNKIGESRVAEFAVSRRVEDTWQYYSVRARGGAGTHSEASAEVLDDRSINPLDITWDMKYGYASVWKNGIRSPWNNEYYKHSIHTTYRLDDRYSDLYGTQHFHSENQRTVIEKFDDERGVMSAEVSGHLNEWGPNGARIGDWILADGASQLSAPGWPVLRDQLPSRLPPHGFEEGDGPPDHKLRSGSFEVPDWWDHRYVTYRNEWILTDIYSTEELNERALDWYFNARSVAGGLGWNMQVLVNGYDEQRIVPITDGLPPVGHRYESSTNISLGGSLYRMKAFVEGASGEVLLKWSETFEREDGGVRVTMREGIAHAEADGYYTGTYVISAPTEPGNIVLRTASASVEMAPPIEQKDVGRLYLKNGIYVGEAREIKFRPMVSNVSGLWFEGAENPLSVRLVAVDPTILDSSGLEAALEQGIGVSVGTNILDDRHGAGLPNRWKLLAVGLSPGEASLSFSLEIDYITIPLVQKIEVFPAFSLAVDMNRDGDIEAPGDTDADATSETQPYRFWVNDDIDRGHTVDGNDMEEDDLFVSPNGKLDGDDGEINSKRDLEDFTRLKIYLGGLHEAVVSGAIKIGLKWKPAFDSTRSPSLKVWCNLSPNGGEEYLTDEAVAQQHLNLSGPGLVHGFTPYFIPSQYWADVSLSASQPYGNLIFEGCTAGKGQLVITLHNSDGAVIGEGAGVWIELNSIEEFYERWTAGDFNGGEPAALATRKRFLSRRGENVSYGAGFEYGANATEENKYVLYVHGWNMQPEEKNRFAETAFKRLYWQGYKGRFGVFCWPTTYNFGALVADNKVWKSKLNSGYSASTDPTNYDRGEWTAWKSSFPLMQLLTSLRSTYPSLNLVAHSMGNIVTGEALRRLARVNAVNVVDCYVVSQAALPAHSYDSTAASDLLADVPLATLAIYADGGHPETANIYPDWLAENGGAAGRRVNFYNVNDFALWHDSWEANQFLKPDGSDDPDQPWTYRYLGDVSVVQDLFKRRTPVWSEDLHLGDATIPQNRWEIMAFAAEARSRAVGAKDSELGMDGKVDLQTIWPDDTGLRGSDGQKWGAHKWHSAQFRSTNMRQRGYWKILLGPLGFNLRTTP